MSLLVYSEHGGQKKTSCTQSLLLLWCWVVLKLWEMFHYHFPFINIVSVVSLSYNHQPLCFICIMTFVILVSDATKNFLLAHFHTSSRERLVLFHINIMLSHFEILVQSWSYKTNAFLASIGNCEWTSTIKKWIHLWTKSCTMIISQSLVYTSFIIW
jgi:hypothetical protein